MVESLKLPLSAFAVASVRFIPNSLYSLLNCQSENSSFAFTYYARLILRQGTFGAPVAAQQAANSILPQ
jgi:hypothetical protein